MNGLLHQEDFTQSKTIKEQYGTVVLQPIRSMLNFK